MLMPNQSVEFEALDGSYRGIPVRPDLNDESAMPVDSVLYPGWPSPSIIVGQACSGKR
jgi:hypothetical protein